MPIATSIAAGVFIAADVASLIGLPLTLVQWYLSEVKSEQSATLTEYIEYLRRSDHRKLVGEIEKSEQLQKDVIRHIALLNQLLVGQLDRLPEKLGDLFLQNLFDFDAHKIDRDDAEFEATYLAHVRNRFGKLRTLGVREMRELRQDLSVAYVSLNISSGTFSEDAPVISAEAMLQTRPLLTVRGTAGSGKTTLLHWIALQCSTPDKPGNPWSGGIPFVVPLRALSDQAKGKPKGSQLLTYSVDVDTFTATPPREWLDRVLRAKRAVLLIDGVDEIIASHRPAFWEWLTNWVEDHPGNRCYVTSRFFADTEQAKGKGSWAPPTSFASAQVKDMDEDDIRAFIERWHKAVSDTELDATEMAAIAKAGEALPIRLFDPSNRRVRELCRIPLLCALVCALHWREEGYLPARRIDLYDRCSKMLLEERDRKRDIKPPEGALGRLSLADKEMLLQRLAWQMMSNSTGKSADQRIEIDRQQAVRWLKPHMKSCDDPECRTCDPSDVLDHLIDRTGLLREPAKGRIDFPHRTFQEYLAACAAGYYDDAGNLAKRSMNDQWHETIVLAAGTPVGGSAFGNRLIEELLRRGTTLKQDRARNLSLALALACLETGMQIRPDLQKRVLEQLSRLVPPRSEVTARHLAVAADALLPHLRYENVKRHGWRAVALSAYAIARVGTHRAIQTLLDPNGYASDTRQSVVREICNCPSLNPLKLPYICQRLRDSTQDIDWQLARTLRNVEDLSPLANDGLIQCLPLTGCKRIDSFKPISTLIGLKYLWLSGTNLTDEGLIYLKALGVLEQLYLMGTQVTNEGIIHLQNLNSLKVLFLGGTQITDAGLAHLKNLTSLRTLSLEGTRVTDEGLAYLQDLRSLTWLSLAGTQLTDAGLAFLQNITSLESLSLEGTQITDAGLIYLQNLKSLNALSLNGTGVTDVGLGNLQNLTSLKSLLLYATRITDGGLAHLHKLQSLVVLSLNNTRVTDAGLVHLKDLTSLQEVSFMGTQISREGMHRLLQTNMRLRRWRISEYSGGSSGV